jgi:hypothetical protein
MNALGVSVSRRSLRDGVTNPVIVRALRDGLSIAGLLVLAVFLLSDGPGYDFFAYWAVDPADPYQVKEGFGAYHYAPPLAWLAAPLKLLPWPLAYWAWLGILILVLVWLARDWALAWLAFPPVSSELFHGNIHLLIAAALVLSLRQPAAYAFLALSKVSPGVSALWWVVRREWRSLAIAVGTSLALIGLSFVLSPALWFAWIDHISSEANHAPNLIAMPILIRLPIAAALVVYAAWRDRPLLLPLAIVLALPLLWIHGLAVLVALTPVLRARRRQGGVPGPLAR